MRLFYCLNFISFRELPMSLLTLGRGLAPMTVATLTPFLQPFLSYDITKGETVPDNVPESALPESLSQGTIIFHYEDPSVNVSPSSNKGILHIGNANDQNYLWLYKRKYTGHIYALTRSGGVIGVNNFMPSDTFPSGQVAVAIAWEGNTVRFFVNGQKILTETNTTMPLSYNGGLHIGAGYNGNYALTTITKQKLEIYEESLDDKIISKLSRPSFVVSGVGFDSSLDVIAFLGQSNSSGKGDIASTPIYPQSANMKMIGNDGVLKPYADPYDNSSNALIERLSDTSPQLSYAGQMVNNLVASTGRVTAALPCNLGGTSLVNDWTPQYIASATRKTFAATGFASLQQLRLAKDYGVLRGIVFHQGESDAALGVGATNYLLHLNAYFDLIQETYPNVPIVLVSLHDWHAGISSTESAWNAIKTVQESYVRAGVTVVYASGKSVITGEEVHLDASGLLSLGSDIATALA